MNSSSSGAMTAGMVSCCCIFVLPLHSTLETCGCISGEASFSSSLNCLVYGFKSIPCLSFGSRNGDSIAKLGGYYTHSRSVDIDRFTTVQSIGDDSIFHLPCLEIAIAGIDFINRHVATIDKIDESILQNDRRVRPIRVAFLRIAA